MGQGPGLRHQRRGGDLHHHVARRQPRVEREERRQPLGEVGIDQPFDPPLGQRLERGERDGEEVQGLRHRLAVEIAAGEHLPFPEHERVIGGGVELDLDDAAREPDRVAHGAEHLGRAAQAVGVLHPGVVLAVRFADLAPGEQPAQERGRASLPLVRAVVVDPLVEGRGRAAERFQAHRRRAERRAPQDLGVVDHEGEQRRLGLGPVDEGEPLLGREPVRDEPGLGQRLRRG